MTTRPADNRERKAPAAAPYEKLLADARHVSREVLERLRTLQQRFPNAVPEDAIQELELFLANPDRERRVTHRSHLSGVSAEVLLSDPVPAQIHTYLYDRSPSGLSIHLPNSVPVGSLLQVRLPDQAEAEILVEVRNCRAVAEGWLAGCQVVAPPALCGARVEW